MSKRKGRGPNLREQLAAALLGQEIAKAELQGRQPIITWEQSKKLTAKQIRARFELDHWPVPVWVTDGVPCNAPWNLTWLPKGEHRIKTSKRDVPAAAKSKRILAKQSGAKRKGRPMAGSKDSKFKRRMDGRVELRT